MSGTLKNIAWGVGTIAVLCLIGYGIELYRRRGLVRWAREQGGTLSSNGMLGSVEIPEAAPFDAAAGEEKPGYDNVIRIGAPEATYVLAEYHRSYLDTKNTRKSFSCVVCFVVLPGGPELPAISVNGARPAFFELVRPERPPLPLPGAVDGFAAAFEARPLSGAPDPSPEALARVLPPAVQSELLAHPGLIAGLQARGRVLRVQAVGQAAGYPHREVLPIARRLAAAWRKAE